MKRNKKKQEFSKLLFIFITTLNVLLLIFSCYITLKTYDTAILVVAIAGTAADQAFAIKYYYRKAEQENKIKLMKKYKIDPEKEDFEINTGGEY
jgi:hypothetical protein